MTAFHPDLYPQARFVPRSVHPGIIVRLLRLREALRRSPKRFRVPLVDGVTVKDVLLPTSDGAHRYGFDSTGPRGCAALFPRCFG